MARSPTLQIVPLENETSPTHVLPSLCTAFSQAFSVNAFWCTLLLGPRDPKRIDRTEK